MKTHKDNFTERKHLECDKCNKVFETKSGLREHIESVHKGLRFPCEICAKYLYSKQALVRHQRTIHGKQKASKCEL